MQINILRWNPSTIGKTNSRAQRKRSEIPCPDSHGTHETQEGKRIRFQDPRTKVQNELQKKNQWGVVHKRDQTGSERAEGVIQVIALQLIYGELGLYLTSNNRSYCSGSTVIKTDVIQKKSDLINLVLSSLMANGFFVEISQVKWIKANFSLSISW